MRQTKTIAYAVFFARFDSRRRKSKLRGALRSSRMCNRFAHMFNIIPRFLLNRVTLIITYNHIKQTILLTISDQEICFDFVSVCVCV